MLVKSFYFYFFEMATDLFEAINTGNFFSFDLCSRFDEKVDATAWIGSIFYSGSMDAMC